MSRRVAFQVRCVETGATLDVLEGSPLWGAAGIGLRYAPVGTLTAYMGFHYVKTTEED